MSYGVLGDQMPCVVLSESDVVRVLSESDVVRGSQGTRCRMWFSVNWMSCVVLRGPDVEEENGS